MASYKAVHVAWVAKKDLLCYFIDVMKNYFKALYILEYKNEFRRFVQNHLFTLYFQNTKHSNKEENKKNNKT